VITPWEGNGGDQRKRVVSRLEPSIQPVDIDGAVGREAEKRTAPGPRVPRIAEGMDAGADPGRDPPISRNFGMS
jgi:hypothetical protein